MEILIIPGAFALGFKLITAVADKIGGQ